MVNRCWGDSDSLMKTYHDEEWGVQLHDDQKLFEFLILEGFQAGLSWRTILHKRENFLGAFSNFDINKVSQYTDQKLESLREDKGIIRNRLKITAARTNAIAFLKIQEEFGSFDAFIWNFVENKPIVNKLKSFDEMPAATELSKTISKDLKKKGFKFIGPTIIYSFMQAVGMVNDHFIDCFRYHQINKM